MTFHWPQIVYVCLLGFHLLSAAMLDGHERTGKHSLSLTMLSAATSFTILWFGGFFLGNTP